MTILILGGFFIAGISFSGYKAYKILGKKDEVVIPEVVDTIKQDKMDIDKVIETTTDVEYLNNLLNTVNVDIKMMGEIPEFLEIKDKILKRLSEIKNK